MKIVGGLFIAFGALDIIGSFTGFDVWGDWIGVELPEAIWSFTAYVELGIGFLLLKLGSRSDEEPAEGE